MVYTGVYAKIPGKRRKVKFVGVQKSTVRAISTIAKKAVMKVAETKSGLGQNNTSMTDDLLYCQNLCYGITQGDTYTSRDGQKIFLKNFYIRGKLSAVNNATVGNGSTTFRVMLIRTDLALTTSSTSITTTDVFRSSANTLMATSGIVDLNKVHVLSDKTYNIKTDISNANQHIPFVLNQKINKIAYYTSGSASYFKDDQYYLLITVGKTDATANTAGLVLYNWTVNFKDM